MSRRLPAVAVAVVLALGAVGCGKGGPGADAPVGAQVDPTAAGRGPAVVSGPQGQQFGVTDQPSGGGEAYPALSPAAKGPYDAGMAAFQAGDLDGAKNQFAKAIEADPKAFRAYFSTGVIKERLNDQNGALAAYRKAFELQANYEPALVAYGVLLARMGSATEADGFLVRQQSALPASAAVTAALAEVKSLQKDSASAQRLAQEALKKNPNYRPAMVTLARDHYRNRRLDLAVEALRGILDGYGTENPPRDKNNAEAFLLRALIQREQGFHRAAREDFKKALELRPDFVEARINLSRYLLEAGDAQAASPMLEAALRYDKNNVLARLHLGDAYRLLGRAGDAKQLLEFVLQKDPTLAQAHYNLGLLYLFSKNIPGLNELQSTAKAIDEFERYKQKRPRGTAGQADDADELITRAKNRKAILEAQEAEKNAPPPPPPPAEPAPPEGGAADPSTGAMPPAEGG